MLIPLLDRLGAPGVVLAAAALALVAAVLFAPAPSRGTYAAIGAVVLAVPLAGQLTGLAGFDVTGTKGHQGDRVLFSKWNSFSRVAVYERTHGDWSLSPAYQWTVARHALHGHRLGGVNADSSPQPGSLERAVPALRADGARVQLKGE